MKIFGMILAVLGILTAGLGFITGFGYFLYLWGAVGLAAGASMWAGFLLWLKMLAGGFITGVIGAVIGGVDVIEAIRK